ncbi:YeiH family protein [uncultured Deefgea sp.]|uniref:YeiH family protein n=1 Tax=uncultured Deefgea sp. TaxID=1304914 RepID=UPI002615B87F|nr:YeiH family protein [uncultured Deefgea sp.]
MTCINQLKSCAPGLAVVLGLTIISTLVGNAFPLMGGAVVGILLGIIIRSRTTIAPQFNAGIQFSSKQILQWSIVGLGFSLPIADVIKTGMSSLEITFATITAAVLSAIIFGRVLKIPLKLCVLIGTGTAICGGSAIAAITPVVKPDEHDTAFALSTIFLFNIVAVLVFPAIGHMLGMSDSGFGMWAGTAINDTSSVVAAAYSWSDNAGDYATIVKLTRAMLIIPVTLIFAFLFGMTRRKETISEETESVWKAVPWFILWFLLASLFGSMLPDWMIKTAQFIAPVMITMALVAIGLSTDLGRMRQTGWRPVALGLLVWVSVASTSLVVQHLTGRW